jgi:hypothetical protein
MGAGQDHASVEQKQTLEPYVQATFSKVIGE